MFDQAKLKYYCSVKQISMEMLANGLGIHPATLSRKMKGESDFYRHEIISIKSLLDLKAQEIDDIFFNYELTQTQG